MAMLQQDLILFDIDGTLLRSEGAGRDALDAAFLALYGWKNAMEGISLAGSTDGCILQEVADRFGNFDSDQLQAQYLLELSHRLRAPGRAQALPGVHRAVATLQKHAVVGLLTGNWRQGAEIKLRAIDLWWEAPGAFGDDAKDRNALVPFARRRAAQAGVQLGRVVVIGDTPKDVACARAGDAIAIAVETGFSDPDALRASQPDLCLVDMGY
jgi:phosphoglycolate phosphatase-like HAD superfamily hydrolase